jgi:ParB/RepB/Spo0J family partition protein
MPGLVYRILSKPLDVGAVGDEVTARRFDENSLGELAASFKSQGVLAPLLVRELDESKYEVIAGARRLRAAKIAELEKECR